MCLNHSHTTLISCHVHDATDNDRVTVNIHQTIDFGTALGDGNADFPYRKTLFRTQSDQLAIGKPGNDQATFNGRRAGTAQCQHRYGAIMCPELFTTFKVQCGDIAIGRLHNHLVYIDLRNGQHFTADTGLPQLGAVIGAQRQHHRVTGTQEQHATTGARSGRNGYACFYLPVFLAGFSIQCHHPALAVRNEQLIVIENRHQVDELLVDTHSDTGLPDRFQGYGICNLNQFCRWIGIIRPPENATGPLGYGRATAQH